MAHIHLISGSGNAAQSATRTAPGENLPAGERDKAANSFEALLAAGADALRAEQAALQPAKKDTRETLDPSADATDLPQLPDAPDGLPLTEQAAEPAQLVTQMQPDVADDGTAADTTPAGLPLAADAGKEIRAADKSLPTAPEMRSSDQPAGSDRPRSAAKALPEPAMLAQQPQQMTSNPESAQGQAGTPASNLAPALQAMPASTQAQPSNPTPATTLMSIEVPEPFGTSGWTNAFSQRVALAVGRNDQFAEIRVNPPHLGPVEVTLTMSGDDNRVASVHFAAHHASVREAIESAIPRLREMFNEAGISLGNATIGSESSGRETTESGRGDAAAEQAGSGEGTDQTALPADRIAATIAGKVDTFA